MTQSESVIHGFVIWTKTLLLTYPTKTLLLPYREKTFSLSPWAKTFSLSSRAKTFCLSSRAKTRDPLFTSALCKRQLRAMDPGSGPG